MAIDISDSLRHAEALGECPAVVARHRIDGPGATVDLREFQQGLWTAPRWPTDALADAAAAWTARLPRTVCLTIDSGTRVVARPYEPGRLCIRSLDYGTETTGRSGMIPATSDRWLLKAVDAFGLAGVAFELSSLRPGLLSSGLGGSATAMTAVCLLANRLAGDPMDSAQIVGLASRLENDLGNSLTGTQEQWNVVRGGVVDYVWLPWGMPGEPRQGLGTCVQYRLVPPDGYAELEARMALFHTGKTRSSADVNRRWVAMLRDDAAFERLMELPGLTYEYREGLRTSDWERVLGSLRDFRRLRAELVPEFMAGADALVDLAAARGAEAFPLGAGGGGSCLVFGADPGVVERVRDVSGLDEIPFRLVERGHALVNC
jgi:D-glycero-alpha-D-manno-heptose-7-phosphate kinase